MGEDYARVTMTAAVVFLQVDRGGSRVPPSELLQNARDAGFATQRVSSQMGGASCYLPKPRM